MRPAGALRHPEREAARHRRDGGSIRQVLRQRLGLLEQSPAQLRSGARGTHGGRKRDTDARSEGRLRWTSRDLWDSPEEGLSLRVSLSPPSSRTIPPSFRRMPKGRMCEAVGKAPGQNNPPPPLPVDRRAGKGNPPYPPLTGGYKKAMRPCRAGRVLPFLTPLLRGGRGGWFRADDKGGHIGPPLRDATFETRCSP